VTASESSSSYGVVRTHPHWCVRQHCTAYAGRWADRHAHRSRPFVVPYVDDPGHLAYYVHLGADGDGSNLYIEIVLLELPVRGAWWHPVRPPVAELLVPLGQADELRHIVASLVRQALTARYVRHRNGPRR
jgi:hypothetical protein